jgi:retron-type reverse transcriptase
MKSLRSDFDEHLTLEKLLAAHKRAAKGKNRRPEVLKFNQHKLTNLLNIQDLLRDENYVPSPYKRFWITDPKKREVLALPYRDRVIHQWFIEEFIKPFYIPRFIKQTYACIPERGTHAAVRQAQSYLRQSLRLWEKPYVMKMDIAKFFNSIDKQIMYDILCRHIAEPKLCRLIRRMIWDGDEHAGLPIGNYISQYFANIYLNKLDQFVKRELKVRFYVRYMDDFVLIVQNKQVAIELYGLLERFLAEKLKLELNTKSRYYPAHLGIDFAGWRIFAKYRLLRKRSKAKINQIIKDYESGRDDFAKFFQRANAWLGHAKHGDAWRFSRKHLGKHIEWFPDLVDRHLY